MPVVNLEIAAIASTSTFREHFVVEMTFTHDDAAISEAKATAFPVAQTAEVVEFINVMWDANDYIETNCSEPEDDEVEGYDKWCNNYNKPGLDGWPTDSNGNYFAALSDVTVVYYDANGTRFNVTQVKDV